MGNWSEVTSRNTQSHRLIKVLKKEMESLQGIALPLLKLTGFNSREENWGPALSQCWISGIICYWWWKTWLLDLPGARRWNPSVVFSLHSDCPHQPVCRAQWAHVPTAISHLCALPVTAELGTGWIPKHLSGLAFIKSLQEANSRAREMPQSDNPRGFSGFSSEQQLESSSSLEKPLQIHIHSPNLLIWGQYKLLSCVMQVRTSKKRIVSHLLCVQLTCLAEIIQTYLRTSFISLVFQDGWVVEEMEPSVKSWHLIEKSSLPLGLLPG